MTALQAVREIVSLTGDRVVTDSRRVAKAFGKQHRNVLQAHRNMYCSKEFALLNFQQCFEINELSNGKPEPVIQMTKDGFMFLVMGFTGQKAAIVKESFIAAFNEMADFIRSQADRDMGRWNVAFLEFRTEQEHASHCGTDLSVWKNRKPLHLKRLERLDPQLRLPLRKKVANDPST